MKSVVEKLVMFLIVAEESSGTLAEFKRVCALFRHGQGEFEGFEPPLGRKIQNLHYVK